jgi:hypothetical protein
MGPILDMVAISRDVVQGVGVTRKLMFTMLFYSACKSNKAGSHPTHNLHPLT